MSLWGRFRRTVARVVERLTEPAPREPEPPRERERETRDRDTEPARAAPDSGDSRLPDGWVLVGLYHQGEKTQRIHATNDTEVTDNEIHGADGIIVQYVDGGEDGYKWIHGATGWDSIYDQIERTVKVVSPAGTGQ